MTDPATYRPAPGSIPTQPGVYKFRDPLGRVVYVGKAKNLRSRLSNYFQDLAALHPRTQAMVTTAAAVEWTVVATEVEALQLEYAWIKEFATTIPDVVFWDVADAYDDGTGRPITGYTVDGIHPSSFGSQHAALLLVPIMQRLIKPVDQQAAGHDAINFFPNGGLAGKRGTSGPRVRGQIADGFQARMLSGGATVIEYCCL